MRTTIIKGFSNYKISEDGTIINIKKWKGVKKHLRENGYLACYLLNDAGVKKRRYVHRLVAEHFLPKKKNLKIIRHKDGNKLNNLVSNLEWIVSPGEKANVPYVYDSGITHLPYRSAEYYQGDLENEVWKKVSEDCNYSVSSYGRIKNDETRLLVKTELMSQGYNHVTLYINGMPKTFAVHNLLYDVFYGDRIDDNWHVIVHIDGNRTNNKIENLKQVLIQEKCKYEPDIKKQKGRNDGTRVRQLDLDGNFIAEFPSVRAAGRALGIAHCSITKACQKKYKTSHGFIFEYAEQE